MKYIYISFHTKRYIESILFCVISCNSFPLLNYPNYGDALFIYIMITVIKWRRNLYTLSVFWVSWSLLMCECLVIVLLSLHLHVINLIALCFSFPHSSLHWTSYLLLLIILLNKTLCPIFSFSLRYYVPNFFRFSVLLNRYFLTYSHSVQQKESTHRRWWSHHRKVYLNSWRRVQPAKDTRVRWFAVLPQFWSLYCAGHKLQIIK